MKIKINNRRISILSYSVPMETESTELERAGMREKEEERKMTKITKF